MKTVLFMPRIAAENLIGDSRSAIISITDPNDSACLKDGWRDVLRLSFNDVSDSSNTKHRHSFVPFNAFMATAIHSFVSRNESHITTLVVHCEAGVSRSAAIALVLAGHYGCELKGGSTSHANKMIMSILADSLDNCAVI